MRRFRILLLAVTILASTTSFFPSSAFSAGPAGVEDGLKFWFSADSGAKDSGGNAAADSEQVETWEDQSTDNRDAARSTGSAIYTATGLNFNPTLAFTDGRYQASDTGLVSGSGDRSIFVVASADSGGWRYVLGAGTFGSGRGFDFGHNSNNGSVFITTHSSQEASTGSWTPYGSARLAYGAVNGGPLYIAVNGSTPVQGSGGSVNTVLSGSVKIGSNSRGDEYWDGNISEVIYFNRLVTSTERQRINSYLALKYGFSLDQSTAQSYLASGSNLMWDKDASGASTYDNDLFGIGRDDASNLSQIKSRGQNSTTVITVEAVGEGTNLNPDFEDIDDLEFLVFGDNGGAASWTTTGAPDGYSVLARQWKKQEQGNVGFVNMDFDVANSNMNIPATLDGGVYYFVYDSDNDGSLADEVPQGMSDQGSDDWRVTVDFGAGGLFTLATTENPAAETLSPVDNAINVDTNTNLVITLSANVTVDTGNVLIKKASDDSTVETISIASGQVTGSGTDTITINPTNDFADATEYYVQIPDTALKDGSNNYFPGITNTTGWSFTTSGDGDGVSEGTEDAAPNSGDGNDDGTDDSEQPNVTSLVNTEAEGDPYITLEVDDATCSSLSAVSITSAPADSGYSYPVGLLDFDATCTSGSSTTVTIYYDKEYDTSEWVVRKYINSAYSTIDGATFGTESIGGTTVTTLTYTLTDGGLLDADGTVNGTIEDPVGPAVPVVAVEDSGSSSSSSSGGTHFGCKDKSASNYEYFSRHKQELCKYDALPVTTSVCAPYMTAYLRYGADNDPEEVRKLERFLNEKEGENLAVDGGYGFEDVEAVKRFQQKYASEVLGVWGLSEPTGYVYRTTLMKINSFYCSASITCPAFTEHNNLTENSVSAEVGKTKTLLSELGFYTGIIDNTFDASLDVSLKSFQSTFSETMLKPWGLTNATGHKYKTTNKFLNMLVGCKTPAVELDGKGLFDY